METKKEKTYPYNLDIHFDPQYDEDSNEDYYTQIESVVAYGTNLRDAIAKASIYAEEQFGLCNKCNSTLVYWCIKLGQEYNGDNEPKILR